VPRADLDKGKLFMVPLISTHANQDCAGNDTAGAGSGGTLTLVGGLVLDPVAVTHPEDIEHRQHRTTRMIGKGLHPQVTYEQLPKNNSDFGCKTVTTEAFDSSDQSWLTVGATAYEVFFSRHATNHPGPKIGVAANGCGTALPAETSPSENWLYYWRQVVQVEPHLTIPNNVVWSSHDGPLEKGNTVPAETPRLGRWGCFTGPLHQIVFYKNPTSGASPGVPGFTNGTSAPGIDYFGTTLAHEWGHVHQLVCYSHCGEPLQKPFVDSAAAPAANNVNGALSAQLCASGWSFDVKPGHVLSPVPACAKPGASPGWDHEEIDPVSGQPTNVDVDGDEMCDNFPGGRQYCEGAPGCEWSAGDIPNTHVDACDVSSQPPPPNSTSPIESNAEQAAGGVDQDKLITHDWASPGQQHLDKPLAPDDTN